MPSLKAMPDSPISLRTESNSGPHVTVLIVVRNGNEDICAALDSVRAQTYRNFEIVVVDGLSTDGTVATVEGYARIHPELRIRILANTGRIQATGWNVGIKAAQGDYILRLDAVHCRLSPEYLEECLGALLAQRGENLPIAAVGGRRLTQSRNKEPWPNAIAAAQRSVLGVGNATYRHGTSPTFVDTLGNPLYYKPAIVDVGLFDESLGRSEDNDLHARLLKAGYLLYYTPEAIAYYYPRTTVRAIMKQQYGNGAWVAKTLLQKRKCPFGIRHFAPFAFYLQFAVFIMLSPYLQGLIPTLELGAFAVYLLAIIVAARFTASNHAGTIRVAIVMIMMHMSYACGTALGGWERRADPSRSSA